MQRRTFLKQSCGACAAFSISMIFGSSLLESCASTGLSVLKTDSKEGKVSIPLSDFETNSFKLLRVNNYNFDIALQKQETGEFTAMVLMCTHARHPLTKAGSGYYCTLHGSKFSGEGKVEKGPASEPMVHLKTTIIDNNVIITL